jgi:hypothetical protein
MKVVSYLKSVPGRNNKPQKVQLLRDFITGVCACGDQGIIHDGFDVIPSDLNMIQGWVYEQTHTPHLDLRRRVIECNARTLCADANLFLYSNSANPWGYLRYSIDGIFPTTGIYFDDNPHRHRWKKIQRETQIELLPYKTRGKYIILCCQRNGGWSMDGINIQDWIIETVRKIRVHTDRLIVIRAHPGDKRAKEYLTGKNCRVNNLHNTTISPFDTPLEQDLHKAWAVVNHNSSSIVGPIIQGFHAFVTDPIKSQCKEVAHNDFSRIENPIEFDRQAWLERISMFHWSFEELRSGEAWRHMRKYI